MARSVGAALSEGLDTGFRMAMDIDAREEDKRRARMREEREERDFLATQEDRQAQRARLAAQDERLGRIEARQADMDALAAIEADIAALQQRGAGFFEQYGDASAIPADVARQYREESKRLLDARSQLRRKQYDPLVQRLEQESANTWSRIQAGQLQIEDLKPADLVRTLTVAAKRDLSDFLAGPDGAPSRVAQAGLDLVAGMETGNEALVLEAANVLLEPELKRGVGEPGKDGSTITRKEIVKFIPHPQIPTEVLPVIRVHVKREDGKIGSYLAPITKNRSADPDDEVVGLDIGKAMDRAGQLTTLAETLSAPGMRERVEQGLKEGGKEAKEFLDAFFSVGGKKPKAKVEWKSVPAGGMLVGLDEQGRQVGEVRGPARSAGLQASLDAINGMVDRGEIDEQTADDLRQAAARSAAMGKKGGGGGASAESAQLRGVQAALDRGDITPEEARERRRQIALGTKPPDAKQLAAAGKERARAEAAVSQAERVMAKVDSALTKVSGWSTGLFGAMMEKIPATERRDLLATLETIKANLGFAELQAMREASPTGGALGAIAVQELIALQSTVASLDANQKPETLSENLKQIRDHYRKWKEAVTQSLQEGGGSSSGASGGWDEEAQPARVASDADFNALPSGALFYAPDGSLRRKP